MDSLLEHPRYWLVFPLPWPSTHDDMAEAAYVIAPTTVSRNTLPESVTDLLDLTKRYAREHSDQRVVWPSDVTRWLSTRDSRWADLNADWEHQLTSIQDMPVLGFYLTISRRAYAYLTDIGLETYMAHRRNSTSTMEPLTPEERQAIHDDFARKLNTDWSAYIREMRARGLLHAE